MTAATRKFFMEIPTMDSVWFSTDLTKDEKKARAIRSKATIDDLCEGRLAFSNPFFTDVWLPHAKRVRYCDDTDKVAYTTDHGVSWKRQKAIHEFSFAIPSYSAISKILEYSTDLIEIGSGSGYWASLLSQAGASVTAVEKHNHDFRWFPDTILADGVQYLKDKQGLHHKALFLCWPALDIDAVLDAFKGDTIVWIGEVEGCTCEIESADWEEIERFRIPTWPLIHDIMIIYRRIGAA